MQTLESKQIKIELLELVDSIKSRLELLTERHNIANKELDQFKNEELENEIRFIERRIDSLNMAAKILPEFIKSISKKSNESIQLTDAFNQLQKASIQSSIIDFFNKDIIWLMSDISRIKSQFIVTSKLSTKKKMKAYSDAKKAIKNLIAQLDEVATQNRGNRIELRFIASHLGKLENQLDAWSLKSQPIIGRPNQKNAERLFMATKLKKYFKGQYGKPFNSVVLAVIDVFYKDSKLSVNEIARIKV